MANEGGSNLPVLGTRVTADVAQFQTGIGTSVRLLSAFGGAVRVVQRELFAFDGSLNIIVGALAALGGAAGFGSAIREAGRFETALTRITTLVGISTEEVESWRGSILRIAEATGKGPVELAEALYAITGGGAEAGEALEILEATAKASALGLGDMTTIGRTATSAVIAFRDAALTGTQAVDVMTAIIKEGNLEAASLAGSLGRVIGIAATVGVSFQELGAFMATFSRLGVDAAEATTSLSSTLRILISPNPQTVKALRDLGTSMDELRRKVREGGLTAALIELIEASKGNLDVLGNLIPETRALAGVLGTAGVQADEFVEILGEMKDATGLVDEGMGVLADDFEQQFNRMTAALNSIKVEMGSRVLPTLTGAFKEIADNMQLVVDLLILLTGALIGRGLLGLVTRVAGLTAAVGGLRIALLSLSGGPIGLLAALAGGIGAVVLAGGGIPGLSSDFRRLNTDIESLKPEDLTQVADAIRVVREEAELTEASLQDLFPSADPNLPRARAAIGGQEGTGFAPPPQAVARNQEFTESINEIIKALREERDELTLTREQILRNTLATNQATQAEIERAVALLREIEAEEAAKEGERRRARQRREDLREKLAEEERIANAIKRRREEERRDADRIRQEIQEAEMEFGPSGRRAWEIQLEVIGAQLDAELERVERITTSIAEAVGSAWEDIIFRNASLVESFRNMVSQILQQLFRLTILDPLIRSLLKGMLPIPDIPTIPAAPNISLTPVVIPKDYDFVFPTGNIVSGVQGMSAPAMVVEQNFTFEVSAIDSRGVRQALMENKDTIAQVVAEAAQRSVGYSRALNRRGV